VKSIAIAFVSFVGSTRFDAHFTIFSTVMAKKFPPPPFFPEIRSAATRKNPAFTKQPSTQPTITQPQLNRYSTAKQRGGFAAH
jgi:hypothetical protein